MHIHFSLRQLLLTVALCAVGTVGVIYPTPLCASIIFSSTVFILLAALLAALGCTGSSRVFWLGFAIAGWGYLWLAHWTDEDYPIDYPDVVPWQLQANGPLVTTKVVRWVFSAIHGSSDTPKGGGIFSVGSSEMKRNAESFVRFAQFGTSPTMSRYDPKLLAFMRVGHSLWTLLFAWLGGQITRYFHSKGPPPLQPP